MRKIRWGIFGTGRIAHQFAQDLRFVPNGELVAVASRHAESATKFAQAHAAIRAYTGYENLLSDPTVEAVNIYGLYKGPEAGGAGGFSAIAKTIVGNKDIIETVSVQVTRSINSSPKPTGP